MGWAYVPPVVCLHPPPSLISCTTQLGCSLRVQPFLSVAVAVVSFAMAVPPPLTPYIQATAMSWFGERKGFASSCVIVGYGAGAMVVSPLRR